MIHPLVEEQLRRLREAFPQTEVAERPDGSILVNVRDLPLCPGWNKERITVSVLLPPGYPTAKPNGFEADHDIALASGQKPSSGYGEHPIDGRMYAHFCWQPQPPWENDANELWKRVKFALLRFSEVRS
jgi:hypothetical protein